MNQQPTQELNGKQLSKLLDVAAPNLSVAAKKDYLCGGKPVAKWAQKNERGKVISYHVPQADFDELSERKNSSTDVAIHTDADKQRSNAAHLVEHATSAKPDEKEGATDQENEPVASEFENDQTDMENDLIGKTTNNTGNIQTNNDDSEQSRLNAAHLIEHADHMTSAKTDGKSSADSRKNKTAANTISLKNDKADVGDVLIGESASDTETDQSGDDINSIREQGKENKASAEEWIGTLLIAGIGLGVVYMNHRTQTQKEAQRKKILQAYLQSKKSKDKTGNKPSGSGFVQTGKYS